MGKAGWEFCKEVNTLHTFDSYGVVFKSLLGRKINFLVNCDVHVLSYRSIIFICFCFVLFLRKFYY